MFSTAEKDCEQTKDDLKTVIHTFYAMYLKCCLW